MSKAVDIFSGILFVRTRHYDDVKKVVVLQGNKPERRFFEERQTGEWVDYSNEGYVECPFCGSATNCEDNKDELHYCWNCGADMRQEETKDDG